MGVKYVILCRTHVKYFINLPFIMASIFRIKEEILIQRLINDDQTAFELLFRYYYPGLVVYASRIIGDKDEAEEIVQDFFVRLWRGRKEIRKANTLKNFFFTSVKNRSLNYLKKEKINEKILQKLQNLVEKERLYQPDLFVESEIQARVKQAFKKLQPRTNQIFKLSRYEGLTNDQIAESLNISKRTVETQISNALKILRGELKDYQFFMLLI